MGKKGRRKKTGNAKPKEVEDFDLGDEGKELKEKYGDVGEDDDDFYEDEIDKFHKGKDKILLEKAGGKLVDDDDEESDSEGEDEVLKFDDDDDEDDDESDEEMNQMIQIQMNRLKRQGKGLEEEDDEDDDDDGDEVSEKKADKAGKWGGTKSSAYYGADHLESDEDDEEETEEAQRLELEEAMLIQKRSDAKFEDADFGLDAFAKSSVEETPTDVPQASVVPVDVSKLSKSEKRKLLAKESPEFLGLVKDFKATLEELRVWIRPLYELVKSGKIPAGPGAEYVRRKHDLAMTYCVNLSFYVMLKAKRTSVADHPVIRRLLQFKTAMKAMEPLDAAMEPDVEAVLKRLREGKEILPVRRHEAMEARVEDDAEDSEDASQSGSDEENDAPDELPSGGRGGVKRKKTTTKSVDDAVDVKMKKIKRLKDADLEEETSAISEETAEDKRKATKEMEKNRGLTPHKRKDLKNPRVRLREKYRKAKIRRKGAVREARYEMDKYGGELSGIRAGLKKGIKLLS